METGAGGENGGGPHAQDFPVENGGLSHRRVSPKRQQMTEFRRAKKRRRIRRKMIRYLTVAGLTIVVGIGTYFFASEGASVQDYIQVPPLTVVLESTEALGGSEKVTENAAPVDVPKDGAEAADALQLADDLQRGNWNGNALFAVIDENEAREAYIGELDVAAYCGCQYCIGRSDNHVTWSDDFRHKERPWRLTLMGLRLVTCLESDRTYIGWKIRCRLEPGKHYACISPIMQTPLRLADRYCRFLKLNLERNIWESP